MPKSGQESFQVWLQRHAQAFIDATSWEEFHGIADAHGVRRIAYSAVQNELRQGIRVVNVRIREERWALGRETQQLSWVDWLQQQATNGRADALEALRVARGRDQAHTISASKTATAFPPEAQAQVTKQGTVIQKVGEPEIRHTSKGLNVEPNVGDDVLIELIGRAAERYEGCRTAYGPADFQLRIARVAGANHLAVSFDDPELEKARQAAQAAAPTPINKAALDYIAERNSKRDRLPDIPFHRLWRPSDAGELTFVGLRSVAQQNLLIASNGTERTRPQSHSSIRARGGIRFLLL